MKTFATILIFGCACAAVACDKGDASSSTTTTSSNAATNTQLNTRDRVNSGSVTPIDQGNGTADIQTTATIRKALMADDSLSTDAKNVKVVTNNGVINLRGPVKSIEEKNNVGAKATAAAGSNRVDNQLDIESK